MSRSRGALAHKLYSEDPIGLEIRPARKRRKGWWTLAAIATSALSVVTLVVLFYLSLCTQIVQDQYAVDRYEALLPSLREENANLEIQVKELSKLSRIDKIARQELHMDYPANRLMIEESGQNSVEGKVAERIGLP